MFDAGETGIQGWTIYLYTGTPSALVYVGETTTDINGNYIFNNLTPGVDYFVAESLPAGWIQMYPNASTVGAIYISGKGYVWAINLDSREVDSGNNFGNTLS